jgi:hypothetical protein
MDVPSDEVRTHPDHLTDADFHPEPDAPDHFKGCHPDDEQKAPKNERPLSEIPDTEECWHCRTLTTRGVCNCADCWEGADYVPPSAVYHCRTCGRWWAYMTPRITTITFNREPESEEADA